MDAHHDGAAETDGEIEMTDDPAMDRIKAVVDGFIAGSMGCAEWIYRRR